MLDKFGYVFAIRFIASCQLNGDIDHGLGVEGHPRRAIGLLEPAAHLCRFSAVKNANIIETKEATLEHTIIICIFSIHPPGKVNQKLVEALFQPLMITLAMQ